MIVPRHIAVAILIVFLVAILCGLIALWLCLAGKFTRKNKIEPSASSVIGGMEEKQQ